MALPAYYTTVDVGTLEFEAPAKQGRLYVAPLSPPLLVLTPPVELASALDGADGPFAYLRPTGRFAAWLRDVEARVLDACVARKAEWLRKDVDDDALRHNFKSFFGEGGELKVRVQPGEVGVFDAEGAPAGAEEAGAGTRVRAVLELARVCFGRQEFGAMWRLTQARVTPVPPCLIADDDTDDGADAAADEAHVAAEDVQEDEAGTGDVDEAEFA